MRMLMVLIVIVVFASAGYFLEAHCHIIKPVIFYILGYGGGIIAGIIIGTTPPH